MLSDDMEARSQHLVEDGPLTIRMVSLDDIFLFKSVANRDDDVDDMVVLAQAGIDEELIVQEVHTQLSLIGRDEFVGAMKHKPARLQEKGYSFDIQDEIERLHSRTVGGERVAQCIRLLAETEYDDELYEGVPEPTFESRVGEETATSGIDLLQQIGHVRCGEDNSHILQDRENEDK
ncbi:hypothetical protein [Haloferax sp. ATB1]|uniref:hypothetical protein n=1 Tax=Haloferax sp. ATB1 TaxID=1508454 RepID=UPI0009E5D619|nr:hypothetical protein [Haloferax sp. ATB1]